MKRDFYNINKSFSEEDDEEGKIDNISFSIQESISRNHKPFEILNDVNSLKTISAPTTYQDKDFNIKRPTQTIENNNCNEIERVDNIDICNNKEESNNLTITSFPKKPVRANNYLSSKTAIITDTSKKREKIRKLMEDLDVNNPNNKLNTNGLHEHTGNATDLRKNLYINLMSVKKDTPTINSERKEHKESINSEGLTNKNDISDIKRGKIEIVQCKFLEKSKDDGSRSNSPGFEGNTSVNNNITVNKASYLNRYKNSINVPYKSRSQEKDYNYNNIKPVYLNQILGKKVAKNNGILKKPKDIYQINENNNKYGNKKQLLNNQVLKIKEIRGINSKGKDRILINPENNKSNLDSKRSDRNDEYTTISPSIKRRIEDPKVLELLMKIKEQSDKIEKKYNEKKVYFQEALRMKDEKISILEENEKKYLQEIEDLKYRLYLFVREHKKQNVRYEKNIINNNIDYLTYAQKKSSESTHLSSTQSPIVEKINNDYQDFKESKSLLEEYDNMLSITDENDMKFYKETNIPKYKSYIYLLREFGLESYTFYNISEKQAILSKEFLDDICQCESERESCCKIKNSTLPQFKWNYHHVLSNFPKLKEFIIYISKRLSFEVNLRLKSEEKSVRIFANDLQNLFILDEKLRNFEKKSKRSQNVSNLSSVKSI